MANKCDLNVDRKVEKAAGQKLADRYGMNFMEVSAKDGTGINELFNNLGESIYDQIKTTEKKDDNRLSLTKENHEGNSNTGCRC